MTLERGARLGAYEVVEPIAEGGLASVWRALAPDGRSVALKVLDAARRAENPALVDRLTREADVLRSLQHVPSVVALVEVFEDPVQRANVLVLEHLVGEPLSRRIGRASDLREVLEWMGHACHALHEVHAAGVVHRDVKPDNVFLVTDGDPPLRLIDFNSATRVVPDAGRLTQVQGTFPNTPAYLAPECFDGVPPDPSADVYALALTFAEVLLGHHPLLGPDAPEPATGKAWGAVQQDVPFPDLRALRPDVPAPLQEVFARATRKEREERIPDAVALWSELKGVWDRLNAGTPEPAGRATQPVSTAPERPRSSWGGAMFGLVGLGVGAVASVGLVIAAIGWALEVMDRPTVVDGPPDPVPAPVPIVLPVAPAPQPAPEPAAPQGPSAMERAAAIQIGTLPVGILFPVESTLDQIAHSKRFGSKGLTILNYGVLPPDGTATYTDLGGVRFLDANQVRMGGSVRMQGMLMSTSGDGFTLKARIDDTFGAGCHVVDTVSFSSAGHPWYHEAKVPCGQETRTYVLFADEDWLVDHPDRRRPVVAPIPAPAPERLKVLERPMPGPVQPIPVGVQPSTLNLARLDHTRITPSYAITFATGKGELSVLAGGAVDSVANLLNGRPDLKVSVEVHTDSLGGDLANLALSQARADALKDALVARGVHPSRIVARGMGEGIPIASNATEAGRAQNRRVEIEVIQ